MADMEHSYAKSSNKNNERVSSFIPMHHDYCQKKRKRSFSSPTGKTPTQETKQRVHSVLETKHHSWTTAEKECVLSFTQTNRIDDAVTEYKYWEKCASHLHSLFPDKIRTGSSCRTMSKRLQIDPNFYGSLSMEHAASLEQPSSLEQLVSLEQPVFMKQTRIGEAQTEPALPFSHISLGIPCEPKSVDVTPLKEGSVGAHYIHDSAIRRLQKPLCISLEEKGVIIDTVMQGDTADIASAILKIPCLHDTLKVMILHDIEEDARKSASRKHSVLKSGNFTDLNSFSWDRILQEMVEKQSLLTEVLLSVAMPSSRIGSSKATESLVPMLGCVYAILMKARFHELSAVQRVLSLALANEHTHQKVYDRLQPLGITLSHSGLSKVLDMVSGHFNAELIDSVKKGDKFRIVGDNINFEIGVTHEEFRKK